MDKALEDKGINPKELWKHTFEFSKWENLETRVFTLEGILFFKRARLNERAYSAVVFGDFGSTQERWETPPRMWGKQEHKETLTLVGRNTPTHVGKTKYSGNETPTK